MNNCLLTGRLTAAPELKTTASGKTTTSFSLAVRRPYSKDTVDFINCCAWGKTAETICAYCAKGNHIGISGMLTLRRWTDADGHMRSAYEVIISSIEFLSPKAENAPTGKDDASGEEKAATVPIFESVSNDGDLPF